MRTLLGVAGSALLARATTNRGLRSLLGFGERGITVRRPSTSPRRSVRCTASGPTTRTSRASCTTCARCYRWPRTARTGWWPGRPACRCNGPPRSPAWCPASSSSGARCATPSVRHEGDVTFEATSDGGTRVNVRLSYVPPAGAFGHAVASIFGADPKSEMDADLLRMKSMIETGHPPHDAARPTIR